MQIINRFYRTTLALAILLLSAEAGLGQNPYTREDTSTQQNGYGALSGSYSSDEQEECRRYRELFGGFNKCDGDSSDEDRSFLENSK